MLHLANGQLVVELLDPVEDRHLLGPRFCWGGYIWQVRDPEGRPLLSGPEWPEPQPDPFNGQGLPESFRHRTLAGEPLTWSGDRGVALGAGEIIEESPQRFRVITPCTWSMTRERDELRFETVQEAAGFRYGLVRTVSLQGRRLQSRTRLINLAETGLCLEWFAHPFFALKAGIAEGTVSEGCSLRENPGFALDGTHLVQRRAFAGRQDGHMDRLVLPSFTGWDFSARLRHPLLEHIDLRTDFTPSNCVIWGNGVTFSIEPYRSLSLPPGTHAEWGLAYDFGPVSV